VEPVFIGAHLGAGRFAPLQLLPALVAAVLYGLRVRRLQGTPRAVPGWRQACELGGLGLIILTLTSPIGHVADELFAVHMAEHLLLGDIATLLIVVGLTGPVIAPILRLPGMGILRVLAHPVLAFSLWALNLYAWHLPALHDAAVRHEGVHALQHACFIAFGINMWMALLGPLPKPAWFTNAWKLGYIVAVRLTGAVLGNVLVFGGGVYYDVYARGEAYWRVSPSADQAAAGGVMMVEGSILTICLLAWLFLRTARQTEERQDLVELAQAHGVALTEARAARAVAAGRGDELRERILAPAPPSD
jgi:putative membrane protein